MTLILLALLCSQVYGDTITFTVAAGGSTYTVSRDTGSGPVVIGANSPEVTLDAGVQHTITFNTASQNHPVYIIPSGGTCHGTSYYSTHTTEFDSSAVGSSNGQGTATFHWTPSAPGPVDYICAVHCESFRGHFLIQGTSSTGTGGSSVVPSSSAAQGSCSGAYTIRQQTPSNLFFTVNGKSGNNPTITITKGCTYTFTIDTASVHPVILATSSTGSNLVTDGISVAQSDTGINSGTIVYTPPANGTVFYYCVQHGFSGQIDIIDAATGSGDMNMSVSQFGGIWMTLISFVALWISKCL